MSKILLTVCVFGLLLSSAAARDAETVPSDRFPNFKKENVRTMTVPTGEMLPSVPVGSFIFVNTQFPTIQLGLGDIVTFYLLKDRSTIYMKRIVGTGGDRIQMINGALYINGQAVKREQVADYIPDENNLSKDFLPGKPVKRWRETLPNGVSYMTLDIVDNGLYDNTPIYKVPPNHYFMMGDNRDTSTDSRVHSQLGYVPVENIIGKVHSWSSPPSPGDRPAR